MKCYFFGTFNPVHLGHMEVAAKIKEQFGFDNIIFVPSYTPPHKFKLDVTPKNRLDMLIEAVGKENVSDVEFFLPAPSYSYSTILELKKRDNTDKINYVIGYDAFFGIEKWMKTDVLKENTNFIVVPRDTKFSVTGALSHLKSKGYNFEVADVDFINISSNMVRERLLNGESACDLLHPNVDRYINEYGLYKTKTRANIN